MLDLSKKYPWEAVIFLSVGIYRPIGVFGRVLILQDPWQTIIFDLPRKIWKIKIQNNYKKTFPFKNIKNTIFKPIRIRDKSSTCFLSKFEPTSNLWISCDGPGAATGLIYMKIRTTIRGPEVRQMIGGVSIPSNSDGPTEKGKRSWPR